ncbi:MAG TPA: hypothetical protein VFZ64_11990 [Nocardioidaceae bacterium]
MARLAYHPDADKATQSFSRVHRGSPIQPNVNVLHTTEGTDWPGYDGGGCAPHLTAKPVIAERRLALRQHFPFTMSARALRNEAGGVETNTLNCMQLELVGTCDPAHRRSWGSRRAGKDYLFWPEAPRWALEELAGILAWMHQEWAVKLRAPTRWPAYPTSYANGGGQRLTGAQWRRFYGTVGHMHVPENTHGDPGDIDIATVLSLASDMVSPRPRATPRADEVVRLAERALRTRQSAQRKATWEQIRRLAVELSERR